MPASAFKVLFVGNSFTGFSATTLQRFAASNPQGEDIFHYEYVGGISLSEHARRSQTLALIRDGHWDYVVLQDHSTQVIRHYGHFVSGIKELVTEVRASGAEPILFQTWARLQTGNYPGDQVRISQAYLDIGAELDVSVARVGDLWFEMYRNARTVFDRLFQEDQIHPTDFGTFAVAVSVYRVMYGGDLAWSPTAGVGTAGDVMRTSALRLNVTRAAHYNTVTGRKAKAMCPAIELLLIS
ncbi:hypothetical protein GCM10008090_26850 [Arenicella chitinivorans]|uniref:SGNH/GDSL hydrolase family protein n=2 Tax=Arenicella chitinivorans TaxID=1329800 RepID=A0A918VNS9_9GAMM|nr:hypothetical protein GCM10008090_26850 [Arenicella chitinivorans]